LHGGYKIQTDSYFTETIFTQKMLQEIRQECFSQVCGSDIRCTEYESNSNGEAQN